MPGARRALGGGQPRCVRALLRGLLQAQRLCEQPEAGPEVSTFLSALPLGLPLGPSRACLPGGTAAERIRFQAGGVWFPWRSHAAWFLHQMDRWGWLEGWLAPGTDLAKAAQRIYRPDLLASAAADEGLPWPAVDSKPEGAHAAPWMQAADPVPMGMLADRFCDGAVFAGAADG